MVQREKPDKQCRENAACASRNQLQRQCRQELDRHTFTANQARAASLAKNRVHNSVSA